MLQEVVTCEECGKVGLKDEIGICGEQFPNSSKVCTDIICPDCRILDDEDRDDDIEWSP